MKYGISGPCEYFTTFNITLKTREREGEEKREINRERERK